MSKQKTKKIKHFRNEWDCEDDSRRKKEKEIHIRYKRKAKRDHQIKDLEKE